MPLTSPALPLTIALGAAAADGAGFHRLAFYLVLLAIPAAATAAFCAAGDMAEGQHVTLRISCTIAALGLLVVSSAARANAPTGGAVPAIAISALVTAVLAYGALGLAWLVRPQRSAAMTAHRSAGAVEPLRESHAA